MALAESYAPEGKVRNLLEVGGVHQIMLEVQVAEMARTTMKKLGVNFSYAKGGDFAVNSLGNLVGLDPITGIGGVISPAVNALFRFNSGGATWTGLVSALNDEGLIKILAEPSLMTLSGQTAHFLAGGEFPVPVPQGLGTVAIEYKDYGVGLSFTPTVLSPNKISIQVAPDISELDFTTSVRVEGFSVPGLRTRRASTMVELADGLPQRCQPLLQHARVGAHERDRVLLHPRGFRLVGKLAAVRAGTCEQGTACRGGDGGEPLAGTSSVEGHRIASQPYVGAARQLAPDRCGGAVGSWRDAERLGRQPRDVLCILHSALCTVHSPPPCAPASRGCLFTP